MCYFVSQNSPFGKDVKKKLVNFTIMLAYLNWLLLKSQLCKVPGHTELDLASQATNLDRLFLLHAHLLFSKATLGIT